MGKRELLLAAAFVLIGFAVYQFTAPPSDPSKPGFSMGGLMDEIRREVRGQQESAEGRDATTIAVDSTVQEIRLTSGRSTVTITGEDREDIEAELHVRSTGYDTEEAARLVKATQLKTDAAGPVLILMVDFPEEGRQTATLSLKVPSRLGLRMDGKGGALTVENIASVILGTARGDTNISRIAGEVSLDHRGNRVTVSDVGSLRLRSVSVPEARISNVQGDTTLNVQGGELRAERLGGGLEVESRNAELHFEHLDGLRGPVRVNALSGEVTFVGLGTEARIDGRNTEVRVEQSKPAPLAIYNFNETIELTVPAAGFTLDARAVGGRVSLDDKLETSGLAVDAAGTTGGEATPSEARASGTVDGGGPTITLRATRGDIVLRLK